MIGEDLIDYLTSLRERLNDVAEHAEIWQLDGFKVVFMPRTEPLPDEPASGLGFHIQQLGIEAETLVTVYPDRRGEGYGMKRFNDDKRIDFTLINSESDVHFTHNQGFIAKTTATDPERLKVLIQQAYLA